MTSFRTIVLVLGILALAGTHHASAQADNSVHFTTSFPFTVGNTTVPAGSYSVAPFDKDQQLFELKGGGASVLFLTEREPKQLRSRTEVVFGQYAKGYVLKNIWVAGSDAGYVTHDALVERRRAKPGALSAEQRVAAQQTASSSK